MVVSHKGASGVSPHIFSMHKSIEHVEMTKNNAKSCTINIEVPSARG